MQMQKIPDMVTLPGGDILKIESVLVTGDTLVRLTDKHEKGKLSRKCTREIDAINYYRELQGMEPLAEVAKPKFKNTPNDGHEHDWEWIDPESDEDRRIKCVKCGLEDEEEDDDE